MMMIVKMGYRALPTLPIQREVSGIIVPIAADVTGGRFSEVEWVVKVGKMLQKRNDGTLTKIWMIA